MSRKDKLTPKQAAFVQEYLVNLNGKQAAIRAGYSPKSAEVTASKLLRVPKVKEAVEKAQEARLKRVQLTQDDVLRELRALVTSNVNHYDIGDPAAGEYNLELREGAPADAISAVSSVKRKSHVDEKGNVFAEVELKLWNKPQALSLAMRHFGMLNDKLQIDPSEEFKKTILEASGMFEAKLAELAKRQEAK